MSNVIVVTLPGFADSDAVGWDDVPEPVRADLVAFRDEVSARFPDMDGGRRTGALAAAPVIEGARVVIRPKIHTRPLVINAVMRLAARRQLTVSSPEQGLVADSRGRVDIDVHRRPSTMNADINDHAVRGRPFGALPWVTRDLLAGLVRKLEVDGDRLDLVADSDRWFRYERVDGSLVLSVADGPGVPVRSRIIDLEHATLAADAGWAWARGKRRRWRGFFAAAAPEVGTQPAVEDSAIASHAVLGDVA